jgi:putative ABC transport system ATP-binding protein
VIELNKVSKIYVNGELETHALKEVDLKIEKGEFIVILGPSGSGKSTMLNVLSGLDAPTSGEITIHQEQIHLLNDKALTLFRRKHLGFIFQQYNLLSTLTVYENIALGHALSQDAFNIDQMLKDVAIDDQKDKYPHQLSGGQQQRVSIARALVKKPLMLFCDEPTGALDESTGKEILALLVKLNQIYKTTILLITHNPAIAQIADRVVKMNSGCIAEIITNEHKKDAKDIHWS